MTAKLIRLAKWLWLALIFAGVIVYIVRHSGDLTAQIQSVSPLRLLLACMCLVAAKLFLVELSRRSVRLAGYPVSFARMFYINSLSQLAKYLPGGIWHFVGRAGYYHHDGVPLKRTSQAMVIENIWLVSSALIVGTGYWALYRLSGVQLGLVVGGMLAIQVAILYLTGERQLRPISVNLACQWAAWTLMGAALWLTIPPAEGKSLITLALGAFAISWAIGYLTIFAPSGLGVREAILVAMLSVALNPEISLFYATLSRLIWVSVELALGLVAKLQPGRSAGLSLSTPTQQ